MRVFASGICLTKASKSLLTANSNSGNFLEVTSIACEKLSHIRQKLTRKKVFKGLGFWSAACAIHCLRLPTMFIEIEYIYQST